MKKAVTKIAANKIAFPEKSGVQLAYENSIFENIRRDKSPNLLSQGKYKCTQSVAELEPEQVPSTQDITQTMNSRDEVVLPFTRLHASSSSLAQSSQALRRKQTGKSTVLSKQKLVHPEFVKALSRQSEARLNKANAIIKNFRSQLLGSSSKTLKKKSKKHLFDSSAKTGLEGDTDKRSVQVRVVDVDEKPQSPRGSSAHLRAKQTPPAAAHKPTEPGEALSLVRKALERLLTECRSKAQAPGKEMVVTGKLSRSGLEKYALAAEVMTKDYSKVQAKLNPRRSKSELQSVQMKGAIYSLKRYIKNFRQNQYIGFVDADDDYHLTRTEKEKQIEYELKDYLVQEADHNRKTKQDTTGRSKLDADIDNTICNLLSYWGLRSRWSENKQQIMANIAAKYDQAVQGTK